MMTLQQLTRKTTDDQLLFIIVVVWLLVLFQRCCSRGGMKLRPAHERDYLLNAMCRFVVAGASLTSDVFDVVVIDFLVVLVVIVVFVAGNKPATYS